MWFVFFDKQFCPQGICDIKRRRELRRNKTHSFLMTKKKKKTGKDFLRVQLPNIPLNLKLDWPWPRAHYGSCLGLQRMMGKFVTGHDTSVTYDAGNILCC